MATTASLRIVDLPNEILTSILSYFNTTCLLRLSTVSHRIHQLVQNIAYQRLLEAGCHKDYKIIFEAYHPATKFTSPYLFCEPLDTQTISNNNLPRTFESHGKQDIKFTELYSTFLPLKPVVERGLPRSHPAGGPAPLPPVTYVPVDRHEDFVCQNINLESYEQFSQLCTSVNLVRVGPKRGLFRSSYKIKEATTRIFRRWLEAQVKNGSEVLWADMGNNIGLRVKALEKRTDLPDALPSSGSDVDEYTLVFEALLVKTTKLLIMLERSIEHEDRSLGRAIVIGSIRDT